MEPDSESGAVKVRDHIKGIISEGCIQIDWQEGKHFQYVDGQMGSSEQRLNYRGLKLIEQVVKVMECLVSGKEIRFMRCSLTSLPSMAAKMRFLLYVTYRRSK